MFVFFKTDLILLIIALIFCLAEVMISLIKPSNVCQNNLRFLWEYNISVLVSRLFNKLLQCGISCGCFLHLRSDSVNSGTW